MPASIDTLIRDLEEVIDRLWDVVGPDDEAEVTVEAISAARALAATGDPRAIEPLIAALERSINDTLSDAIIEALRPYGAAVVEPTLEAFDAIEPDDPLRSDSQAKLVEVLRNTKVLDPRILGCFLELVKSDPVLGVMMVAGYGDARVSELLATMLDELPVAENASLVWHLGGALVHRGVTLTEHQLEKVERARREMRYASVPN